MYQIIIKVEYWDADEVKFVKENYLIYAKTITEAAQKISYYVGEEYIKKVSFEFHGEEGDLLRLSDRMVEEILEDETIFN